MKSSKQWAILTLSTLALSMALVGCGGSDNKQAQGAAGQQAQQATPVGVIIAQPQSVEQTVELTGRLSAYQEAEVRPQTSGIILRRLFTEGSYVKAGQALYELDSRTNRANLANARAALLQQQASLQSLKIKLNRYAQLVSSNAVSRQDYDDLVGQVKVAQAQVEAAQAQVKSSEVDLGYSVIRAPISGIAGISSVTAGALVTSGQATSLVTIQQLNPMNMDISQSSTDLLRLRQQLNQGSMGNSQNANVKLKLEDGSIYPTEGKLAFANASVDKTTGAVTIRAVFDNPQGMLLPGMFATAQVVQGVIPNAYLIPQTAVTRTPTGSATLFVVNAKNIVETRNVKTSGSQGNNWIITEGLAIGDKVVVDGVAKIKEGATVQPSPYNPNAQPQQAGQATGQTAKQAQPNANAQKAASAEKPASAANAKS